MGKKAIHTVNIQKFVAGDFLDSEDFLAVEEPLEIRIEYGLENQRKNQTLSVTMRTPGHDEDLVTGFLFTEGIIKESDDLQSVIHLPTFPGSPTEDNIVLAKLNTTLQFEPAKLERHFYTTSSCGVCGKTSIEAVMQVFGKQNTSSTVEIEPNILISLPDTLRKFQSTFDSTGGLHGCAFFTHDGQLLASREDVGRHNALDKLIGHWLKERILPASEFILLLSGRASFELLQKAAMAGVQVVCAVGAPSSLAAEAAADFGITLIGFLRDHRFNIYTHPENLKFTL